MDDPDDQIFDPSGTESSSAVYVESSPLLLLVVGDGVLATEQLAASGRVMSGPRCRRGPLHR